VGFGVWAFQAHLTGRYSTVMGLLKPAQPLLYLLAHWHIGIDIGHWTLAHWHQPLP
jgi:hypothetical protein